MIAIVAVVVAVAAAGTFGFAAFANHLPVADTNDTSGPLDVRTVEVFGSKQPRWKVITWPRWTTAGLFDAGYAMVFIDTIGTERADYYILVGSAGTHLYADIFRDRQGKKDYKVFSVSRIGRADKKSFYVRIPLSKLKVGARRVVFRWRVQTLFTGDRCRRVCFDLAPDEGMVSEPLPFATPSPTPTPTPTPTATPSP